MWFHCPLTSTVPGVATWRLGPDQSSFGNRFDRLAAGHLAGRSRGRAHKHEPVSQGQLWRLEA